MKRAAPPTRPRVAAAPLRTPRVDARTWPLPAQVTLARVRQVITSTRPSQVPTRAPTVTVEHLRPRPDTLLLRARLTMGPHVPSPAPRDTRAAPPAAHASRLAAGPRPRAARWTAVRPRRQATRSPRAQTLKAPHVLQRALAATVAPPLPSRVRPAARGLRPRAAP